MYALDPLFYDFKRLYKLIFDIMFSTLISYNENGAFESQIDEITQISQKLRFFFNYSFLLLKSPKDDIDFCKI